MTNLAEKKHHKISAAHMNALDGSIEKWEGVVAEKRCGNDLCALCCYVRTDCNRCVLLWDGPGCGGGSYWANYAWANREAKQKAAQAMLDYLRDLKSRCTVVEGQTNDHE